MIVETDEFYLGFILLLVGTLNEEHIQQIIIHQDKELVKAGVECFKMDSDGMCFYWYNPASIEKATKLFEQLGKKLSLE
ncbi:hypothetical protein QNI16_38015 [Cytophagaceae bacterium YF14B1]|uniref:Uncharacterized protein n=1 Tax=Xanthocytophaga flava TaxID=3048013 RepID=A0AAE3R1E7_9BACT|nr:hypothetical protein [Xanthocytophaga flavus]MDJ1486338.1 hypothetical protein [Xanthocytophaga flavus]